MSAENVDQPIEAEVVARPPGPSVLAIALVLATAMFVVTVAPIAAPVLFGALLAAAAAPLHQRLQKGVHNRSARAGLLTLVLVLVVLIPLTVLTLVVIDRLDEFLSSPQGRALFSAPFWQDLLAHHPRLARLVPTNALEQLGNALSLVGRAVPALFAGLASLVIGLFLVVLTTYFLLRDGRRLYAHIERILPLETRHTRAIANEFVHVGRAFFIGTLGTALIQGIVGGTGYALLGLPQPVLLGALTAIGSLIPMAGSGLVWMPTALILIGSGNVSKGLILIVFGAVIVASVDNIVRPLLQRGGSDIHPLFFFLAIFGGLAAFGAPGLYMGPLFVSLFVAVARIYENERAPSHDEPSTDEGVSTWRLVVQRLRRHR